jgi:hypothetical protein
MKYFIIIFIFFTSTLLIGQGNDSLPSNKLKSLNELSYNTLFSLGYTHLWNINGKAFIGTGGRMGFSYTPLLSQYADIFFLKVFVRNVFDNKYLLKDNYDIGIYSSITLPDLHPSYGIVTSYYLNLSNKVKIGLDLLIGHIVNNNSVINNISFLPVISYKFIKNR